MTRAIMLLSFIKVQMSDCKKRKLEDDESSGITHGVGIHRKLDINEEFEKGRSSYNI